MLLVDEINVRSLFRPIGLPAVPNIPAPAQNLRVSLTVAGFARTQPAAAGKSEPAGQNKPDSQAL
jgi:hypothetical protein